MKKFSKITLFLPLFFLLFSCGRTNSPKEEKKGLEKTTWKSDYMQVMEEEPGLGSDIYFRGPTSPTPSYKYFMFLQLEFTSEKEGKMFAYMHHINPEKQAINDKVDACMIISCKYSIDSNNPQKLQLLISTPKDDSEVIELADNLAIDNEGFSYVKSPIIVPFDEQMAETLEGTIDKEKGIIQFNLEEDSNNPPQYLTFHLQK